ncbi:hypothetical protein DL93DRAFT_2082415, partial [Clavulina sp. PMI_390]
YLLAYPPRAWPFEWNLPVWAGLYVIIIYPPIAFFHVCCLYPIRKRNIRRAEQCRRQQDEPSNSNQTPEQTLGVAPSRASPAVAIMDLYHDIATPDVLVPDGED